MRVETTSTTFADRTEAGHLVAAKLSHYRRKPDAIVVGLPRGGVVTAAAIAEDLELPLDVLVVRKLGTPQQEELAMGAIGPGGVCVLNDEIITSCRVMPYEIDAVVTRERRELKRRERRFRGDLPQLDVAGQTVIVVDDGLATGATMLAAVEVIRRLRAARVVVAVPVAPPETCKRLRHEVDELVCLESPEEFGAIGYWYDDFEQVEDDEVARLLEQFRLVATPA